MKFRGNKVRAFRARFSPITGDCVTADVRGRDIRDKETILRHCFHFFFFFKITFSIDFFFLFSLSYYFVRRTKIERRKERESFDLSKIKRRRGGNRARQNPYRSIVRRSR